MGGQSHRTDLGPRSSSLTRTPGISHSVECDSPEPSLLAACTSSHCYLLGAGSPGCPAQLLAQEGLIFFFYVLHIPKETPAPRHRSCLSGEDHLAVPLVSFKAVLHEGGRYCHKNSNESSSKLGTGIYDQLHTCVLQGLVRGQPGPGEGTAGFKAVGDKRTSVQNQFHNH